jgi:hypothetical protein
MQMKTPTTDIESVSSLLRRVCKILDLAQEAVHLLGRDGYPDPNGSAMSIRPEKIIGETAFFLLQASKLSHYPEVAIRVQELVPVVHQYARSKKTATDICLHPALALEYAQAHICLVRMGYPDERFDELLYKSLAASSHLGKERPPHRMLEQYWIRRTWESGHFPDDGYELAFRYAALAKPMDLIHGTTDDFYAFTHALMYITDFTSANQQLPRADEILAAESDAILARCMWENDHDLAGEVLLTWPLTAMPFSPAASFVFHYLSSLEDETGFLPLEDAHQQVYDKMEATEQKKYRFATGYHTAYVIGLLCAVTIQSGTQAYHQPKENKTYKHSAREIMPFLETSDQPPRWLTDLCSLPETEQDALSGWLLELAIVKAARTHQYDHVYTLLSLGYTYDLTDTELARQAAEMLDRLALLGELYKKTAVT